MSNYESADYGPGAIAELPPTIGFTSRAPTIGSEDPGRPIKPMPVQMTYNLGDNGNGAAPARHRWLLPVGIGLAIGGVLAILKTQ
jgi:hypothetical protein